MTNETIQPTSSAGCEEIDVYGLAQAVDGAENEFHDALERWIANTRAFEHLRSRISELFAERRAEVDGQREEARRREIALSPDRAEAVASCRELSTWFDTLARRLLTNEADLAASADHLESASREFVRALRELR